MSTNLKEYKERVKRLRSAVSSVLNVECTQSQAYEIMAKEENYPNWDALSASINKGKSAENLPSLTSKEQITQLFMLNQGFNSGIAFFSILPFLIKQKNRVISEGWSKVTSSKDFNFAEILAQTGLFSEEILLILTLSNEFGNIDRAVHSAIEFLRMDL